MYLLPHEVSLKYNRVTLIKELILTLLDNEIAEVTKK